ncbi:30S ribosomal protein THX [Parapedobacter sp.]|nr:30S ribosomal protein THX [Parapedobacter sp.]
MGKGDKKTKRGKIVNGTYGRRRQPAKKRKKASAAVKETDGKSS